MQASMPGPEQLNEGGSCQPSNPTNGLMRDVIASLLVVSWLDSTMRTTLNIDDDLLIAVKEVAKRESRSAGAVVSGLLRESLTRAGTGARQAMSEESVPELGFRPFPKRGAIVTNELIDRLRAETES